MPFQSETGTPRFTLIVAVKDGVFSGHGVDVIGTSVNVGISMDCGVLVRSDERAADEHAARIAVRRMIAIYLTRIIFYCPSSFNS